MSLKKTTELINSCDAAFKRSGLLRLAESAPVSSLTSARTSIQGDGPPTGGTVNVLGQPELESRTAQIGSAAVDLNSRLDLRELDADTNHAVQSGMVRPLGIGALDAILPGGGLPTGKVIELSLSGGAACGTQMALWACRAAQQQAQLNGTDSWCAFIDPTASLHAPGVLSNGVSLPRLLVLRPSLEDVERVALRLSEANVFSVIIIDLIGVPWLPARIAVRSTLAQSKSGSLNLGRNSNLGLNAKRQNWNRTVRQLALRLEHTQAQVIVLSNAEVHQSLPLPVALRLHMRADVRGVTLQVVKEAQGRVGAHGTVAWSEWGHDLAGASSEVDASRETASSAYVQRAKALPLPRYADRDKEPSHRESVIRTADRNGRETEIPVVTSSRLARTSRASL